MRVLTSWRRILITCRDQSWGSVTSFFMPRQKEIPKTAWILENNFKMGKYFTRQY